MLRSKIHRATITESELNYEGSITIDRDLMEAAGILPYEQVMVSNLNNGERFVTYVLQGEKGSGTICLNGPTARKGVVGDKVIIFCYAAYLEEELKGYQPIVVQVDEKNRLDSIRSKR
ncbi:MAG: aspartate 1-decarboxylase [Candidatus Manganitrophaceae bacterium]